MFSPGQQRYDKFIKTFNEANVDLTKENQYKKGQELWNSVKSDKERLAKTIRQLKTKAAKRKSTLQGFWTKTVTAPPEKKQKNTVSSSTESSSCSTSPCSSSKTLDENETSSIITNEEGKYFS